MDPNHVQMRRKLYYGVARLSMACPKCQMPIVFDEEGLLTADITSIECLCGYAFRLKKPPFHRNAPTMWEIIYPDRTTPPGE